mgnify:FL=1
MLLYTFGVVAITATTYWLEQQRYLLDIDARLLAAANNIPSILPVDFHDKARSKHAISETQDKHHLELMSQHARTGDLTYLYTYVMDEEGLIYFTSCNYTQEDIEKDQVVTYWTTYPEGAPQYFSAMTATKPVYVTAGDRWGLFRTILVPMKSPGGLSYVAAADMDITVIQESLLNRMFWVVLICLSMLLLAIPLAIAYRRTYVEMNGELHELNQQLQIDIERAAELEKNLLEATKQANTASEIKSQFLANMSHELRTPINGVIGMNDLLLATKLSEEQREYARLSNQSADILLDTVNQILDLASIEACGMRLKPEVVETSTFFNDIIQIFSPHIADKQLDLTIHLDSSLPATFQVDAVRLRQVLINLIANAIKFTEHGGIQLSLSWKDEILSGHVADSGCGIPSNAQARIFETFQQVDNSATRNYRGTGLGLPLSQQICRAMNGDLVLNFSDEKGSEFSFYVTALIQAQSPLAQEIIPSDIKSIAFTESKILGHWLESEFHSSQSVCHFAHSASQTMDDLKGYNLILVDSMLGLNVLMQLSEVIQPVNQRLIWLAWSGQQLPETLRDKVSVVHKPLSRQRLIDLCRSDTIEPEKSLAAMTFSGRVLLVDDNAINLKAMYEQLINMGLVVDQVNNGAQAIQLCTEHQYDLILMDVQMPGMDGLEATRRIHKLFLDHTPPIIGISAHVMDSDIANARKAGMADYLCKPVIKAALQSSLSKYLT